VPRICKFIEAILSYLSNPSRRNTYILPKIIFDLSVVLSPHMFLLGLLFVDHAFDRVDGEEVLISTN
jgi:hypothetical protein